MSIRQKLLWLLLPFLIVIIAVGAGFFYYNWTVAIAKSALSETALAQQMNYALLATLIASLSALLFISLAVLYVTSKVTKPLEKLNNAALEIAAGDYEEDIDVEGPREFADLANTLDTMRECLLENMNRLRESSAARERFFGEYECAVLLQNHMFQKAIDNYENKHLSLYPIKVSTTATPYGLYLEIEEHSISFVEAKKAGFQGIYELLDLHSDKFPFAKLNFPFHYREVICETSHMPAPLIWKHNEQQLVKGEGTVVLENHDLIFLINQGFAKHFSSDEESAAWFKKILRQFSKEGMPLFLSMVTSQLNFLVKKHHVEEDIYILCLRVEV